jgi:hypothetical protein
MKEMSLYLLGVEIQCLRGGNRAQRPIFNRSIECKWALVEFYMYVQYKSHNDATLGYVEDALHRFYTFKDVFLTQASWQKGLGQSQCPDNATREVAEGRRENKC